MFSKIWNWIKEVLFGMPRSFPHHYELEWDEIEDECSADEMPFVEELEVKKPKKAPAKKRKTSGKKKKAARKK